MKFSDIKIHKKNPIAWGLLSIAFVILVLFVDLLVSLSFSRNAAKHILQIESTQTIPQIDWTNPDNINLFKQKLWLENQITLSEEDSMSMGINLKDSILQVQIKGLPLMQSKILFTHPSKFLSELDASNYQKLFGQPTNIISDKSNYEKRPIRKMKATEGSDAVLLITDTLIIKRFYWEFVADNNIRIVINGWEKAADSVYHQPSFAWDIFKFRIKSKSKDASGLKFHPTLFLWMDDKEAKAIYRALPKNTKLAIQI